MKINFYNPLDWLIIEVDGRVPLVVVLHSMHKQVYMMLCTLCYVIHCIVTCELAFIIAYNSGGNSPIIILFKLVL